MEFGFTAEQEMLRRSFVEFLNKECSTDFVRDMINDETGFSRPLWKKMAGLEWLGLMYDEKYGGMESSFLDLFILFEQIGKVLLPSPLFTSAVLSGMLINEAGADKLKDDILPQIIQGNQILTLALLNEQGKFDGDTEYQTPLTVHTVKLTVKFNSDTFPNAYGDTVYLEDAVSTGSGCQMFVGYASDGTDYGLYIVDKDTSDVLSSAAVTLSIATQYTLEMVIAGGAVTGTIKSTSGTALATTTASAADSSNKYVDCLMQEPSFGMELTGSVIFDDFTISTGE